MRLGRPIPSLVLNEEQRRHLEHISRRRTAGQADVLRARVVLACAEGQTNQGVAKSCGVNPHTVGKWRHRFLQQGLSGLLDLPRSGPPRQISDDKVEEVIRLTLESQPEKATHWSTRSLARRSGLSHDSIARIWKAFGLQPHRQEVFQLSTDPLFIEKVRDVVGLYMSPPHNALVLCVDEKSQIQALERSQPMLPMRPGRPERRTHDYFRHGTLSLFAALNIRTGEVLGRCSQKHRQKEFLDFLKEIENRVPKELEIHVVLDNYATHKTPSVRSWLIRHPRWQLHFIPTHSSWLNQVERFFAEITTKRLRRGVFRSLAELRQAIQNYINEHNRSPKPFQWTASADLILGKVHSLCNELV
jgi:transposase